MYRVAWLLILNGRPSGRLQFSRDGKKYDDVADAIAEAQRCNERCCTLEYCVVGNFTREVMWSSSSGHIRSDAVAQECCSLSGGLSGGLEAGRSM